MRILHIAPHLGGGVGKAHASLCAAAPGMRRHYVLLEEPRDRRFFDRMQADGASFTVTPGSDVIARLAAEADIVQVEWWNHPRLYEYLCRAGLPATRTVFWAHVSGLFAPFIPTGLFGAAHRFALTSRCSLNAPNVLSLPVSDRARLCVVNSGFAFGRETAASPQDIVAGRVAYLGTVDFSKLSRDFFTVIDAVEDRDFSVSVFGNLDAHGEPAQSAAAMRQPARVRFEGHTPDPATVLASGAGIFLYLLQPQHFGTAENALIEAMSLGWVPLVFANPAEAAIVRHGETGFVERDAAAAARRLAWMLDNVPALRRIGAQAAADVATTKTPAVAAKAFGDIYRDVMSEEKRLTDYGSILGRTPAEWFLSTQALCSKGAPSVAAMTSEAPSKGSLAHFLHCFPGDPSLAGLH